MNYSYSAYTPPRPVKHPLKRWWLVLIMVVVLVAGTGIYFLKRPKPIVQNDLTQQKNETKIGYSVLEGKYLFSGTIVLARAVEKYANGDYSQPFSGMDTFGTYDAGVADLECPVTSKNVSYQQQIDNLQFNCRPQWLPTLVKHFQIVNLAGNHTYDMGSAGFVETVDHLQKAGIQAVGNYTPRAKDDICEVVSLPVRLKKKDGTEEKGQLPIAFCSWHYFSFSPEAGEIEAMQRYAKIMPVFALMHAGTEYLAKAQPNQVDLAHKIIDAGPPEFLIGNSPHWVQNTEVYKGKLIVYSTGNFIFDQIEAETQRGASIMVSMGVDYDDNIARWLALGEGCQSREDTCLEEAEKLGLSKIKLQLKYEAIANTSGNRKVTKKGDAALQKAVEERLNWFNTLKALGQ